MDDWWEGRHPLNILACLSILDFKIAHEINE